MTFLTRSLALSFSIAAGDGAGPPEDIEVAGLRTSASLVFAGGAGLNSAQLAVYGMTLDHMNRISTVGLIPGQWRQNYVTVTASDSGSQTFTQVYKGTIVAAWADLASAPEAALNITGAAGFIQALTVAPPSTYPGQADAAVILSSLAAKMGLAFENKSNASVQLSTPYFEGSLLTQAKRVAEHAKLELDVSLNTLAIWPKGTARKGNGTVITPSTNIVGYPAYNPNGGLMVTTEFNPTLQYGVSVQIKESQIPRANGTWIITGMTHELESETPGGKWFTHLQLGVPGYVVISK